MRDEAVVPVTTDEPSGVLHLQLRAVGEELFVSEAELEGVNDRVRDELAGRPLGELHVPIWVTLTVAGDQIHFTVDEAGNRSAPRPAEGRAAAWLVGLGAAPPARDVPSMSAVPEASASSGRAGVDALWSRLAAHPLDEIE